MENNDTVYIFTNEGMPGLVKIGYTSKDDIRERAKELYTSGVPFPFEIYYACKVKSGKQVEKILHNLFSEHRVKTNQREFFYLDPSKAKLALLLASFKDTTPKEEKYISKNDIKEIKKTRQANFTFPDLDIPFGAELLFVKDKNIICTVFSENLVEYNGEIITLSEAARKTGMFNFENVQGLKYWTYENETLVNRRKRLFNKS